MQFLTVASAIVSVASIVSAATPPACVVNAIGVQGSDATDFTSLCVEKADLVVGNLTTSCDDDMLEPAYEVYSSTCLAMADVTVAALPSATDDGDDPAETTGTSDDDDEDDSGSGGSSSGSSSDDGDGAADDDVDAEVSGSDDASAASLPSRPGMLLLVGSVLGAGLFGVVLL